MAEQLGVEVTKTELINIYISDAEWEKVHPFPRRFSVIKFLINNRDVLEWKANRLKHAVANTCVPLHFIPLSCEVGSDYVAQTGFKLTI